MTSENPREIAARVLQRQPKARQHVEEVFEEELASASLSPADRRLAQELVYGVVRWRATLDWLIERRTQGRPTPAALRGLLRLGLYQLFWLDRVPEHAVVHTTVDLAKGFGFARQAGFVNAVLRNFIRERAATRALLEELKIQQPSLGYSHPDWLTQRWEKRWGAAQTAQLLDWNNHPPFIYARVNTLRIDPGGLLDRWREEGIEYDFFRREWIDENLVFHLKSFPRLESLRSFREGGFYVQDPSTLLAVKELDPRPGETILDFCAAPGGKTTFIAQLMANQGRIVARDTEPERLARVSENAFRLGINCIQADLVQSTEPDMTPRATTGEEALPPNSALRTPHSALEQFDRVLVDAPCSNTGVLRRRVDLRWLIRPGEIERLARLQASLLHQAASQVKPGGLLVYSTCSLEPEENASLVADFLGRHPEFILERERELLPFVDGVDEAYVARLRHKA